MLDNLGYTHTHTHSQYVILIDFLLQRWLQEPASILRYTSPYIACFVYTCQTFTVCVRTVKNLIGQSCPTRRCTRQEKLKMDQSGMR